PLAPLKSATVEKDKSQPFPCMNSPCGCRSAEECWRHCCCHSLAERMAWARENHVRPPDDVLADAKAEGIVWQSPSETDCCDDDAAPSEHVWPSNANESRRAVKMAPGLILLRVLECQGVGGNWLAATVSLLPPAAV